MLHGHIGLTDQRGDVPAGVGQQADTHRCADHQFMTVGTQRHPQLFQQAGGDPHQARQVSVAIEQHAKLIARQTRHRIGLGHGIANATGHLFQQVVSLFMTQAVIEQLEAVQIDMQQGQAPPAQAHALAGLVQAQTKQRTVGKPRQLVVVGQVTQSLL
ncbi:hypothetical protein D3C80_1629950 [compost metagenome]